MFPHQEPVQEFYVDEELMNVLPLNNMPLIVIQMLYEFLFNFFTVIFYRIVSTQMTVLFVVADQDLWIYLNNLIDYRDGDV